MGTTDPDRERRLAEALRANLRRRKAQARDGQADQTRDDTQPAAEDPASNARLVATRGPRIHIAIIAAPSVIHAAGRAKRFAFFIIPTRSICRFR